MNELIEQLVGQLNISEGQAKGGAGLLLKLAKEKLADGDFTKIASVLGPVDDVIQAAPGEGGLAKAAGGLMAAIGGGKGLGELASLAASFKSLDLDPSLIGKFADVITSFLQAKGGDDVGQVLHKLLSRLTQSS